MEKKKRIWTAMVLIWMVVIFMFSAKPADESSKESLFVGRMIGQIFMKDFGEWTKEEQEAFAGDHQLSGSESGTCDRICGPRNPGSGKMQVSEKME
ncbi:MAG: hypothetical protein ACLRHQ_05455 [Sellimonas intestinalis]|uniref:hypothetical protein n=1 Tax=Sellimonas intestinalis TaxID=1653434 RepID=UPI00399F016F